MSTQGEQPAPPDPQQNIIEEFQKEAAMLPPEQRMEHEMLVAELAAELALSQTILQQAGVDIQHAREMATRVRAAGPEKASTVPKVPIDLSRIGWVDSNDRISLPTQRVEAEELDYDFVDIIGMNRATNEQFQKILAQSSKGGGSKGEGLRGTVIERSIPMQHKLIKEGRARPVSIGGRTKTVVPRSLNTTYPAYKFNVQGTNNRAIILALGPSESGRPTYALAALYDHADSDNIHRTLFLARKQKR